MKKYVDNDHIFGFNVPMDDVVRMEVGDCREQPSHDDGCALLRELVVDHLPVQLSIAAQFLHQVNVLAIVEHFVETDDIGVLDVAQDLNLSQQLCHQVLVSDRLLFDGFQPKNCP